MEHKFSDFSEFKESNHKSMNLGQFKDRVFHMCLAGAAVASWTLTQEVVGWQVWKHLGKNQIDKANNSWQFLLNLEISHGLKVSHETITEIIHQSSLVFGD